MRTGTRGLFAVAALLLFAEGALARGVHSIVEDASGRAWDKKLEQGETLRIDVNADGIDFATGVRTSSPLVTARILSRCAVTFSSRTSGRRNCVLRSR